MNSKIIIIGFVLALINCVAYVILGYTLFIVLAALFCGYLYRECSGKEYDVARAKLIKTQREVIEQLENKIKKFNE